MFYWFSHIKLAYLPKMNTTDDYMNNELKKIRCMQIQNLIRKEVYVTYSYLATDDERENMIVLCANYIVNNAKDINVPVSDLYKKGSIKRIQRKAFREESCTLL